MNERQQGLIEYQIEQLQAVLRGERRSGWSDAAELEPNLLDIADALQRIAFSERPDTFREWMEQTFERDDITGMYEHGMGAGWPYLTYYSDMVPLYECYEGEIWETVDLSDVVEMGYPMDTETQFKGAMVWRMADTVASMMVQEWEEAADVGV